MLRDVFPPRIAVDKSESFAFSGDAAALTEAAALLSVFDFFFFFFFEDAFCADSTSSSSTAERKEKMVEVLGLHQVKKFSTLRHTGGATSHGKVHASR